MPPRTPGGMLHPPPPGITLRDDGADVCVYATHADGVSLCLFEPGDVTGRTERRVELTDRLYGYWFGFVPGLRPDQRYAFRVHGRWAPAEGLRYNGSKLLLDPYARALEGEVTWRPEVFAHQTQADLTPLDAHVAEYSDSASFVPRCVVVRDDFDWSGDQLLHHPLSETVVYEGHVRNLTMGQGGLPVRLRGTYAGVAAPATLEHLTALGVTALELLPVQAFVTEPQLHRRGLRNHWGYNTLGYFAPHAPYAAAKDPQGVLDEFKGMVKALHAAGIEVLLDVVYNHTAEQAFDGPTLSWRGLDNRAYYRLDEAGYDVDVTGCGNTFDVREVATCRMILDSLRYWVTQCHVDGFRFDLAVALGRGRDNRFDSDHPLLVALRTDPVLSSVKCIAEPWDLGPEGWRTGQFPPPFSEWNDRFRDQVRSFWLVDVARERRGRTGQGVRDLATRLAGSADLFHHGDRASFASVNYVASHDGFTAADLTMYSAKHNEANGEANRDGTDANLSWNHGVEGPASAGELEAVRRRSIRNLLGTVLLSAGVPMVLAGDEVGHTQHGNNNAYCQDNELSWIDWQLRPWQEDLLETTRFLTTLRARHPVLRQRSFFTGTPVDDGSKDLEWYAADGTPMTMRHWGDNRQRTLQMYRNGAWLGHDSLLVVLHGGTREVLLTLPRPASVTAYELLWDSVWERPAPAPTLVPEHERAIMAPASLRVYRGVHER